MEELKINGVDAYISLVKSLLRVKSMPFIQIEIEQRILLSDMGYSNTEIDYFMIKVQDTIFNSELDKLLKVVDEDKINYDYHIQPHLGVKDMYGNTLCTNIRYYLPNGEIVIFDNINRCVIKEYDNKKIKIKTITAKFNYDQNNIYLNLQEEVFF